VANLDEFYLVDLAHNKDLLRAPDGDLQTVMGLANLKQALFHRLITSPGSLIHRPDYGVGIKDYQNSLNTLDTQRKIANVIDEQFRKDFRVQEVTGVRVTSEDATPETVRITVKIKPAGLQEVSMEFVPFGENN
jgi:hypothetical protein